MVPPLRKADIHQIDAHIKALYLNMFEAHFQNCIQLERCNKITRLTFLMSANFIINPFHYNVCT